MAASAQQIVSVVENEVAVDEAPGGCAATYSSPWQKNWFLQLGAGIRSPFVENYLVKGDAKRHVTATYNLGVGHWITPYLGWRFSGYYGKMRWDNGYTSTAKVSNLNFDILWDMCNSLGGVNTERVVSVSPFVGVGGTFVRHFEAPFANIVDKSGEIKTTQWAVPVSAGVQVRVRLCRYADFFIEGRALFYGDNFNNTAYGDPVDVDLVAIGGLTVNLAGPRNHQKYNPCDYMEYINSLNSRMNALREELAANATALAQVESQLPCPDVEVEETVVQPAPMLSTVRFTINSSTVSDEEMVNVYNVARWLKDNPDVTVVVTGYADRDTGSPGYNMALSERRARAVADILTSTYGIDPARISVNALGSDEQAYPDNNNWNRIVVFALPR